MSDASIALILLAHPEMSLAIQGAANIKIIASACTYHIRMRNIVCSSSIAASAFQSIDRRELSKDVQVHFETTTQLKRDRIRQLHSGIAVPTVINLSNSATSLRS